MAGVVLAETSVASRARGALLLASATSSRALFFFVFGLTIDLDALGSVGWLVALAVARDASSARSVAGYLAGRVGGFTSRQGLNAGAALVAHGEFTIILAQLASENERDPARHATDLVAFAGLYVLVTATVGIVLMKESKRIGRVLFPPPRLEGG